MAQTHRRQSKKFEGKLKSLELDDHLKVLSKINDNNIQQNLRKEEYSKCLVQLKELQSTIENHNYGTYSMTRKQYHYNLSVCHYNNAVVHQILSNINSEPIQHQKALEHLEKSIKNFEQLQGFILCRQQTLTFILELVKMQLQFCGILSHNSKHEQAITYAEKCLTKLAQCLRILQAVCYQHLLLNTQPETTVNSREKENKEMVNFRNVIIKQAKTVLQELMDQPHFHKVTSQKEYYKKIIKNIYSWKNNHNTNQKILKQQLHITQKDVLSPRNILGLQKKSMFISNYEIGNLMTLQFKPIKYKPNVDPFFLMSHPKITEITFFIAASYFTMATQIRFSKNQLQNIKTTMKINQKFQKLNHDENLLKCKIFHLKALEIGGRYLPSESSFFSHLLQSFNKNYKFIMDQIHQESQQISMRSIHLKDLQKQQGIQIFSEYGIKEVQNKNKHSRQLKRKSSVRKRTSSKASQKQKEKKRSNSKTKIKIKTKK